MSQQDDNQLMHAIQNGRPELLGELFTRHHGSLFSFFRKLGHAHQDAEDLLQETFIRMLRYADSFNSSGHFHAWMYRIARNAAHDAWRKHKDSADSNPELEAEPSAPVYSQPEQQHQDSELQQRLQTALLRLPRAKRELILLSRVKGLSMADLAALTDSSSNAVKVGLHRSLEQLRKLMFSETAQAPAAKSGDNNQINSVLINREAGSNEL